MRLFNNTIQKNTSQLWDNLWKPTSQEQDLFELKKVENSVRWERIEQIVLKGYGSLADLRVIEIGAGVGLHAAAMARRGAKVTVLDYSKKALERSQMLFKRHKLTARYLLEDALELGGSLIGSFDISMSFGLCEHFQGSERVAIIKSHFDLLRPGGTAFISVPNKFNLPYRIAKFAAEVTRIWRVGEEYPFSAKELKTICQRIGVDEYEFFGESLFVSLDFLNPIIVTKKLLNRGFNYDLNNVKKEKGTPLDKYLSYAIVLCGKKRKQI